MSKVSKYLNEHILGEVVTDTAVLKHFAIDGSVLTLKPEFIVYPRVTNDIRKVARFAWQLAEKGHVLSLTARGSGSNETGAAIGSGAIVSLPMHMNRIFECDVKQKLIRLQPGASVAAVQDALSLQGLTLPPLSGGQQLGTIGGAVASDAANHQRSAHGTMRDWVHQLEVVLANGDVLQTDRISKRELNKRKGLQGLEGDIYRELDGIIEDNKELIDSKIASDGSDNVGYSAISQVKRKDGSFDLTPLIAGSQGTLGIISEMILKTEFVTQSPLVAILTFSDSNSARDAIDQLVKLSPASLEYYDAEFFEGASEHGKKYAFYEDAKAEAGVDTVLVVQFNASGAHARKRSLKKLSKIAAQLQATMLSSDGEGSSSLDYVRDVTNFHLVPLTAGVSAPALLDGAFVPFERFEDFSQAVKALAKKYHVSLPLYVRPVEGTVSTRPHLQLQKVGDKQKVFKLMGEYASAVEAHSGYFIGEGGEGRLKATIAHKQLDDDVVELFAKIKAIFDPHNILNPGVKQPSEARQLVSQLRSDYDRAHLAE